MPEYIHNPLWQTLLKPALRRGGCAGAARQGCAEGGGAGQLERKAKKAEDELF